MKPKGVFLLLGASGSGKGTVAKILLETGKLDLHRSMGEMLRACLNQPKLETQLGGSVPQGFSTRMAYLLHAVHSGLLVPDAWTERIVEREIESISPTWFWAFDGYPRTVRAAKHLLWILEQQKIICLGVVELQVPYPQLEQRLLSRGRVDDTPQSIQNRFDFYQHSVLPTIDYLGQHIPRFEFDATQDAQQLAARIYSDLTTRRAPK